MTIHMGESQGARTERCAKNEFTDMESIPNLRYNDIRVVIDYHFHFDG
jgi:hypothetical protein